MRRLLLLLAMLAEPAPEAPAAVPSGFGPDPEDPNYQTRTVI